MVAMLDFDSHPIIVSVVNKDLVAVEQSRESKHYHVVHWAGIVFHLGFDHFNNDNDNDDDDDEDDDSDGDDDDDLGRCVGKHVRLLQLQVDQ